MPTRQLYNLRIPSDGQSDSGLAGLGHDIESLSGLDSDQPVVEALGISSGENSINATYSNPRAPVTSSEMEELLSASGFEHIPYYMPANPGQSGDGYIAVEDGSVQTASAHDTRVQSVSATFTRSGTRGDHRRQLKTNVSEVHRNEYGNEKTALVAIPATAGKRTWFKRKTRDREAVAVESTVEAEGGQLDLVDASAVSMSPRYQLIYDVGYDEEWRTDITLWDDMGYASKDDAGVSYAPAWMKVYRTGHEFEGVPVVDTGRLRLYLDEANGLSVEEYDSGTDSWSSTSLPTSDWELFDVDVTGISPVKVGAQCVFRNPTTTPSGEYALNLVARRGRSVVHWLTPDSVSDPVPDGLQDYLDPVADPAVLRPNNSLGLIAREEVRR